MSWVGYLGGLLVCLLIAFVISPLFPGPLNVIIYWLALIIALLCAILLAVWFIRGRPRGPREPMV